MAQGTWMLGMLLVLGSPPRRVEVSLKPEHLGVAWPLAVEGEAAGCLVAETQGPRLVAWGQGVLQPDGRRRAIYLLPAAKEAGVQVWRFVKATPPPSPFRFVRHPDGRLELLEEGKPVWVYNFGPQLKEGVAQQYRRADYLHPLYDLDGTVLTDDFPKDHLHHRGLFWAWPEVKVGESTYDPWACQGIQHRFEDWLAQEAGPICAVLGVQVGWYLGERRVVRERVWLWTYRADEVGRILDVALSLEAEDEPVPLRGRSPDKGYGGFTLRFAPFRDASIVTPQGRLAQDGVHVRLPWADFSARFRADETFSGAALFDHPQNPHHPTPWLLRYYGVLNPEWPALEWATLERGKPMTLRYRVWIHRGDARGGKVANAFAVWADPPSVREE